MATAELDRRCCHFCGGYQRLQAIEKDGDADGEIPKDQKALKLSTYVISDESGEMEGLTNGVHRPYGYPIPSSSGRAKG